ncbi:MAG: OmpH family outer membrane protein [Treponema sp.]|nr:OmpH family outer membrane protein [Treponema sp.]
MKRLIFVALFACAAASAAFAQQQITRFALVDLNRVYSVFFLESTEVRQLELDSAAIQAEINRMTAEIQGLQSSRVNAMASGNRTLAAQLENDIRERTEYLREFHAVRTAELEARRAALVQTDEFFGLVYSEIRHVAETGGFTMVLDLNATPGVLWYSPTVDITDRLIQSLLERRRQ